MLFYLLPAIYTRVWDVADYVIPPAENGAFFVATNVIITANQSRGQNDVCVCISTFVCLLVFV